MRDHCCHFVVWEILGKTESHDSLYFGLFSRRLVFIPQFSRVAGRLAHLLDHRKKTAISDIPVFIAGWLPDWLAGPSKKQLCLI